MSWRAESTFKPSSALVDDEKEYLKVAKKIRDILKLEERESKGEKLEELQKRKIGEKAVLLKEVAALAVKLPAETELFQKNQDITDLLPSSTQRDIDRKREQDQERRQRKVEREAEERQKPVFMCRHDRPILAVAVAADGRHLFTCSKDKYVLCWSMAKALLQSVCTFAGHTGAVWTVDVCSGSATSPHWLISGAADSKVMLWEGDTTCYRAGSVLAPKHTLEHGGIVRALRWCPFDADEAEGTRRFASASEKLGSTPPSIAVWSVNSRGSIREILRLQDLPGRANDLQWGGGAKLKLFSAHDNGFVGVWAVDPPGSLLKTIRLHSSPISSLFLTADGATLLTASHDATAKAVDVSKPSTDTLAVYKANRRLNAVVASADYQPDSAGFVVLGGGTDSRDVTRSKDLQDDEFEAKVLDSATGDVVASGKGHFGPIHALLSLPRLGSRGGFASASEDGCLRVHDFEGCLLHSDTLQ